MQRVRRFTFSSFGVPVSLSYPRELAGAVETILPPVRARPDPAAEPKRFRLERRGRRLLRATEDQDTFIIEGEDHALVLDVLDRSIREYISFEASEYVFLHAGAVAVGGLALVLPAPSMAGKSTLVAALLQEGATYLSDEYAVLDKHGRVIAYPRPISIREPGTSSSTQVDPATIGPVADGAPIRVGLVALTAYEPAARSDPRRLTPGVGALRVFENCVTAATRPEESLGVIRKAVEHAVILDGPRGEAEEFAPALIAEARALATER